MSASAVHSLWTSAVDPIAKIDAPKIEYAQLAPTLIVVGAAVLGILIEGFVPRKSRYYAQLFVSSVALVAAFAAVVALAADGYGTTKAGIAAMGAIAVDGPALFLQGTILLTALVGLFTFAERRLDPQVHGNRVDSFAAQASSVPGSDGEKKAVKAGFTTTEVFPLLLFAVAGMLVFPAANDLLTLFVALEVLSSRCTCSARWPAASGSSRRRPRSSTSCSARSPPRSSSSGSRCCTATRARCRTRRSRRSSTARSRRSTRRSSTPWATTCCSWWARVC